MEGKRFVDRLRLRSFLSYGRLGVEIELEPLNVLIGANASGKSNFIEALAVLRALPKDLSAHFRLGGGVTEYVRKAGGVFDAAYIEADLTLARYPQPISLQYGLLFASAGQHQTFVIDEHLTNAVSNIASADRFYWHDKGMPMVKARSPIRDAFGAETRIDRQLEPDEIRRDQSILAQIRDAFQYPEVTLLASQFESIALYQEWNFGRRHSGRIAQGADMPSDFLLPDESNLGLVLHDLMQRATTRTKLLAYLQRFYEGAQFISTRIHGGTVQLYIEERGGELIPATRLSDGTLRYLALLAILCHPSPPPLICIEEPELGLHPDVIPTVAELLKDAAQRTQLVVTTHSDSLVSALSDVPESIVVCESGIEGTSLRRLKGKELSTWLENYSLGEIWRMGEIGGNRW
jgi:predicted ATPase